MAAIDDSYIRDYVVQCERLAEYYTMNARGNRDLAFAKRNNDEAKLIRRLLSKSSSASPTEIIVYDNRFVGYLENEIKSLKKEKRRFVTGVLSRVLSKYKSSHSAYANVEDKK